MDIYQSIWNADQTANGIKPVSNETQGNAQAGFVVVNEAKTPNDLAHRLFTKVVIPPAKQKTYDLVRKLFNNYSLDQTKPELQNPEEDEEVHKLLEAIVDTPPMRVARDYAALQTGQVYNLGRWYSILKDTWFSRFSTGGNPELSAFEHVIVGEQKQSTANGYHFWYKYFLDDSNGLLFDNQGNPLQDSIEYISTAGGNVEQNLLVPEVSTISYRWMAFDYDAGAKRPLFKKVGGFFNGCSIEGLLALGTTRFLLEGSAPKEAIINGALYQLKMHRSDDAKHLRTFYPEFTRTVGDTFVVTPETTTVPESEQISGSSPVGNLPKSVRIIAALVNPAGNDEGRETVTLINTTPNALDLTRWKLIDTNRNSFLIANVALAAGQTTQIVLPKNTAQLSNNGGELSLVDAQNAVVDKITYSRLQASQQGFTITF